MRTDVTRISHSNAVLGRADSHAAPEYQGTAIALTWSHFKIRVACLVILGATLPAVVCFAFTGSFGKWLSLVWLAGIALLMHGLSKRACADEVVFAVDRRGIIDHRLMPRHIEWHEIEAVTPVDPRRSHVVEIKLRWPQITLAGTRWPVRIGAYCQLRCGIPAVTVNLMLLDGNVCTVLEAVARYRPDLLHPTNRRALAAHR